MQNLKPPFQQAELAAGVVHIADAIAHGLNLENDACSRVPKVSDVMWSRLTGEQDALVTDLAEIDKLFQELVVLIML
jgi:hypothetical protein